MRIGRDQFCPASLCEALEFLRLVVTVQILQIMSWLLKLVPFTTSFSWSFALYIGHYSPYPLLQEPLKIKDANKEPGFEPVAYQKQGFPTETPVFTFKNPYKNHTKPVQNPYNTRTFVCFS